MLALAVELGRLPSEIEALSFDEFLELLAFFEIREEHREAARKKNSSRDGAPAPMRPRRRL